MKTLKLMEPLPSSKCSKLARLPGDPIQVIGGPHRSSVASRCCCQVAMAPAMKKKRVAKKGFCVKEAANRILKKLAIMRKRATPKDCTLRRVEGRLGRGRRRRWRLPGGREACWGGRGAEAAQMTVMVVVPGADIGTNDSHGGGPGCRHQKNSRHQFPLKLFWAFRGELVPPNLL